MVWARALRREPSEPWYEQSHSQDLHYHDVDAHRDTLREPHPGKDRRDHRQRSIEIAAEPEPAGIGLSRQLTRRPDGEVRSLWQP